MELFLTFGWIIIVPCIFADLFFPQYGLDNQGGHLRGAWMGIFNTHDACSITVAFLLSVPFYMRPSSSFSRLARIVYIVLSLLLIVMSQGRTGWIVAAFLLLYVSVTKYLKRYRAKDVIPIAFLSGAAAVVAVAGVVQYYTAIVLLLGKDPTLTGRTAIWRLSIAAAMKRPLLGYGYRAFWHGLQGESANLSLAGGWIIPAAHNGFLDLWLGLGAVGVGAVVYSMFRAAKNAFTCFRAGSSSAAEWYLCIVFVTIVSNVAQLTLMVPSYLGWTLYVLACIGLSQEARRVRLGMVHA
jgi:O-antigen ligase